MAGTQQPSRNHEEKCAWCWVPTVPFPSLPLSHCLGDLIKSHGFKHNLSFDDSRTYTSNPDHYSNHRLFFTYLHFTLSEHFLWESTLLTPAPFLSAQISLLHEAALPQACAPDLLPFSVCLLPPAASSPSTLALPPVCLPPLASELPEGRDSCLFTELRAHSA